VATDKTRRGQQTDGRTAAAVVFEGGLVSTTSRRRDHLDRDRPRIVIHRGRTVRPSVRPSGNHSGTPMQFSPRILTELLPAVDIGILCRPASCRTPSVTPYLLVEALLPQREEIPASTATRVGGTVASVGAGYRWRGARSLSKVGLLKSSIDFPSHSIHSVSVKPCVGLYAIRSSAILASTEALYRPSGVARLIAHARANSGQALGTVRRGYVINIHDITLQCSPLFRALSSTNQFCVWSVGWLVG